MIYRLINGERVIAQTISNYHIDSVDWIPKSPRWILDCLNDLRIVSDMGEQVVDVEIADNKVQLPCDIKSLTYVSYNSSRVTRVEAATGSTGYSLTYQVLNNNYIELNTNLTFDAGDTVRIYFKSFPMTVSTLYGIHVPLVPDVHDVIQTLSVYILLQYLYQGFKHSVFSLESNNPYTNPALMYNGADGKGGMRQKAINSAKRQDMDGMNNIEDRLRMLNESPERKRDINFNGE